MQLGGATASVTALGRCVFALPVLGALLAWERKRHGRTPRPIQHTGQRPGPVQHSGQRPEPVQHGGGGGARLAPRSRWLARISGLFLAADLILWSHSIAAIGAGLGTVVPSFQVLFISLLAWLFLGERPRRSLLFASPVMLAGLILVGGLTGAKAYGADPARGVIEGMGVAVLYSCYILALRQAMSPGKTAGGQSAGGQPSPVAALYEATLGGAAGSVVIGLALRDFRLPHPWPALGWLLLLALSSQVIGWLLITVSMPRLPAWIIGAILLIQPVGTVTLGYLILSERPSGSQLAGVALMLAGVLLAVSKRPASTRPAGSRPAGSRPAGSRPAEHEDHPPGARGAEGDIAVEIAVTGGDREPAG
jgi:drug/metabolite transporter (DMT)-like permease